MYESKLWILRIKQILNIFLQQVFWLKGSWKSPRFVTICLDVFIPFQPWSPRQHGAPCITRGVSVQLLGQLFGQPSIQTAADVKCRVEKPYAFIVLWCMFSTNKRSGYFSQTDAEPESMRWGGLYIYISVLSVSCYRKSISLSLQRVMANEANAHQTLVAGNTRDKTLICIRLVGLHIGFRGSGPHHRHTATHDAANCP